MTMRLGLALLACIVGRFAYAGDCDAPARAAEAAFAIPPGLLGAIGQVETGRMTGAGTVEPWPWSVNAEGRSYLLDSKAAAVTLVGSLQRQGIRSIDVGCFQINLLHHPDAFASLDQAFDPAENAVAAGRFLRGLHDDTGAWEPAVANYHSANPAFGLPYMAQVLRRWSGGGTAVAGGIPLAPISPRSMSPRPMFPGSVRMVFSVRVFVPGMPAPATGGNGGRLPMVFTPSR